MTPSVLRPFWLESSPGRLSVVSWWPTDREPSSAVVIVPPFAEEMNKCRHMLALQGQALAASGVATVLPDLYGTGDSDGDFSDASWNHWLSNVADAVHWARRNISDSVDILAVRSGALLALEATSLLSADPRRIVLWAPTVSGRTFLTQFLRVQLAAGLATASAAPAARNGTSVLWKQLEAGQTVEIAGYRLPSAIAIALRDSDLESRLRKTDAPVTWFEVVSYGAGVGAATQRAIEALQRDGRALSIATVPGESFWATPEIALVPDLVSQTTSALVERRDPNAR